MDTINVGLIGFGMAGQLFHAPIIHSVEGLHMTTIRTGNAENQRKANDHYPTAKITTDTDSMMTDPNLDLIVIASPNQYHYDLAQKALRSGKHVIVDKPFTIDAENARKLIALSKETRRILSVYQNRRWDSGFHSVKEVLRSGKLGRIVEMEIRFDRFRNFLKDNWREERKPGAGVLYDLGPHVIDEAICHFGLPTAIAAEVKVQRSVATVDDYFDIHLYYEDGLKVILKASMLVMEQGPRIQVHGERGSFVKYGSDVQEAALKAGKIPKGEPGWGHEPESQWGLLKYMDGDKEVSERVEPPAGDYRKFYENIRDAIGEKVALAVEPIDAMRNIELIEMAMESSKLRRTITCDFK